MKKNIAITFHGGAGEVTGSNFLVELPRHEKPLPVLVDCGLRQGCMFCEDTNREPFPYDPSSVEFLFITHAHMDHIGRIPKLVKEGFRGVIYSTPATRDLSALALKDSLHILEEEARRADLPPLYKEEDVDTALALWKTVAYREETGLPGDSRFTFLDAGHILGSAMVEFLVDGKKLVFTGDLGNSPAPLLHDTEAVTDATYLVMESVYGDRAHEEREERQRLLEEAIEGAVARGGALLIPAFSIERTQTLLYEFNRLVAGGRIPSVPVFLDSPLAIKATQIYKERLGSLKPSVEAEARAGDDVFAFPNLRMTETSEASVAILKAPDPKIIIAGSGMSHGGRILRHERAYLPDPRSTVLLVGYQAPGSLGRALLEGARQVVISGEKVPVRATIVRITGYSAHKDSPGLIEFVSRTADSVKNVFVTMGEPGASLFLAQRLRDYLGVNASVPERGERVEFPL